MQGHVPDLKPLGDRAIPLLASLITDPTLGDDAADTMLKIDPIKAAPIVFASMPRSSRNVQKDTFDDFLGWFYEGKNVPFKKEMHDAAIRCIEADSPADVQESALYSLGFTGDASDFPFLEHVYDKSDPDGQLRNAAESALARLGNEEHLANIEAELAKPIPVPMTLECAGELCNIMDEAGFTQNKRFIPILCRHLDDPMPNVPFTDVTLPDPNDDAVVALDEIIGQIPLDQHYTVEDRVKWWKENRSRFAK